MLLAVCLRLVMCVWVGIGVRIGDIFVYDVLAQALNKLVAVYDKVDFVHYFLVLGYVGSLFSVLL